MGCRRERLHSILSRTPRCAAGPSTESLADASCLRLSGDAAQAAGPFCAEFSEISAVAEWFSMLKGIVGSGTPPQCIWPGVGGQARLPFPCAPGCPGGSRSGSRSGSRDRSGSRSGSSSRSRSGSKSGSRGRSRDSRGSRSRSGSSSGSRGRSGSSSRVRSGSRSGSSSGSRSGSRRLLPRPADLPFAAIPRATAALRHQLLAQQPEVFGPCSHQCFCSSRDRKGGISVIGSQVHVRVCQMVTEGAATGKSLPCDLCCI